MLLSCSSLCCFGCSHCSLLLGCSCCLLGLLSHSSLCCVGCSLGPLLRSLLSLSLFFSLSLVTSSLFSRGCLLSSLDVKLTSTQVSCHLPLSGRTHSTLVYCTG